MIAPHKYLDLNLSLLNLGGVILSIVKEQEVIKYDELLEKVTLSRGINAKEVFIPALSFLYLLGKIEYQKDIDTIEYIK
ncbi:ABC-three component system middle component 8 [Flavobacterium ajazii]|uniref:ABC-three component system middle component 8 n=1 Tax=Flavobacterium ajazii TaxID=2692318 RepID=UPI0013D1D1F4|nr:ABC-three component system middle component 8 [Flavobacterium ajazii]